MIGKYLSRMLLVVAIIALAIIGIIDSLKSSFEANIVINGSILAVLLFGALLSFLQVLRLGREWQWIVFTKSKLRARAEGKDNDKTTLSTYNNPTRKLATPVLLAPLANMIGEREKISGDIRLSPASTRYLLDSVSLRLEESSDLLRYFVGLLVFIGLLGTFWGLMQTLESVGIVIRDFSLNKSDIVQSINNIRSGLTAPIRGMSTAFSSSLFGLGGSVILGLLSLFTNQAQNHFHNELEEWFSSITRLGSTTGTDGGEQPVYIQSLLEHTADALDKIGWNLQQQQGLQQQTLNHMNTLSGHLEQLAENDGQNALLRQMLQSHHKLEATLHRDRQEMSEQLRDELRLLGRIFAGKSKPQGTEDSEA